MSAIVIGAGAAGAWAAKELTEGGLRVLLLDAGVPGDVDPTRQPIQSTCYAYGDATRALFVDDVASPYETPEGRPFRWIRSRGIGGRMRLWARVALRLDARELERWPITLDDLAPFYER